MRGAAGICAVVATVLLTGGGTAIARSEKHATPPPPEFFGVVPQAPSTAKDLMLMKGVVGRLRILVSWADAEPAPGEYDFAALDAEIGAAADHGIPVQPFVPGPPAWLATEPARPPLSSPARAAWVAFLHLLVRRYGIGGEFWRGRARREPIRLWQIWNEP